MTDQKQALGSWGENTARQYFQSKGYVFLESNYRSPHGELDLIFSYEGRLIFVEVKARSSVRFGYPEAAITPQKFQHIQEAALYYLDSQIESEVDWQIDVLAVLKEPGKAPELKHFENVYVE